MQPRLACLLIPMLAGATLAWTPSPARAQAPVHINTPPGLNLSPAQQAVAKTRQQQYVKAMTTLQANQALTPVQKTAKMGALYKAHDAEMLSILTPQQRTQVMAQRAVQMKAFQSQRSAAQAFQSAHKSEITAGSTLAAKLNKSLSPAQKTQIGVVRKQLASQGQGLSGNNALSPQAKQQQWLGDEQGAQTKILAVLTPAQKTDYLKMQQMQKQLMSEMKASQPQK